MEFQGTYDSEQKIWRGKRTVQIFNRDCSIGQVALQMMRSKPAGTVCQISDDEGTKLTFDTASAYAVRIAQKLNEMGITQDDIVGLVTPNTTLQMPVIVGCWLNCTPFHGVHGVLEEHIIRHCFGITKPKVIFCAAEYYEKVKRATSDLNVKFYTLRGQVAGVPRVEELLEPTQTELFYQPEKLKYGCKQAVVISCSSGTTGLPKAVTRSNASLLVDSPLSSYSSVCFTFSTPDWITGLFSLVLNVLVGGTRIITAKPYTPEYMLDIIQRYEVSLILTHPTQLTAISLEPNFTEETVESLRMIFVTGGHCSQAMQERLRAQLTDGFLCICYGLSEGGGVAENLIPYKQNSVGQVLPNTEIKIIDQDTQASMGHNQLGEICLRPAIKWMGYYNNVKATQEMVDADGWVHTGDLGYMDEENYLFLMDRSRDVLKYKGMHYSPYEIEEIITEMPDVVDVCAFGVFSDESGDSPAAAVVKSSGSSLTEADVINYVAEHTDAYYKHLHQGVYFVEKILRNSNGKALRKHVKEFCLGSTPYDADKP